MKKHTPPAFWRNARQRCSLIAGRCSRCSSISYPEANECRKCGSTEFTQAKLAGRGKLVSWTIVHAAPAGFQGPYAVGIVELEEGPLFTAQIIAKKEQLRHNAPVKAVFRKMFETEDNMIVYGTKFEVVG